MVPFYLVIENKKGGRWSAADLNRTPELATPDLAVVAGHERVEIARELGLEYVPVLILDVSDEEAEELLQDDILSPDVCRTLRAAAAVGAGRLSDALPGIRPTAFQSVFICRANVGRRPCPHAFAPDPRRRGYSPRPPRADSPAPKGPGLPHPSGVGVGGRG